MFEPQAAIASIGERWQAARPLVLSGLPQGLGHGTGADACADRLPVLTPGAEVLGAPAVPTRCALAQRAAQPLNGRLASRQTPAWLAHWSRRGHRPVNTIRTIAPRARQRRRGRCEGRWGRLEARPCPCRFRQRTGLRHHPRRIRGPASSRYWPVRAPTRPAWRTPAASSAVGGSHGNDDGGAF